MRERGFRDGDEPSMSIVNILNFQLMKLAGEDGVAAYGVIMYVNFIFMAIFLGYSIGSAPIVSYHYGAQNHAELKNLFKKACSRVRSRHHSHGAGGGLLRPVWVSSSVTMPGCLR